LKSCKDLGSLGSSPVKPLPPKLMKRRCCDALKAVGSVPGIIRQLGCSNKPFRQL
jgi:hypothetical protein